MITIHSSKTFILKNSDFEELKTEKSIKERIRDRTTTNDDIKYLQFAKSVDDKLERIKISKIQPDVNYEVYDFQEYVNTTNSVDVRKIFPLYETVLSKKEVMDSVKNSDAIDDRVEKKLLQRIDKYYKELVSTEFIKTKIDYQTEYENTRQYTFPYIFNRIEVNDKIPIVVYVPKSGDKQIKALDYYEIPDIIFSKIDKIYKQNDSIDHDKIFLLMLYKPINVRQKLGLEDIKYDNIYDNLYDMYINDKSNIVVNSVINVLEGDTSEQVSNYIRTLLPDDILGKILKETQHNIRGVFFIPNQIMHKFLLSHIVMFNLNNDNEHYYFDESEEPMKKILRLHYKNEELDSKIVASLTPKFMSSVDKEIRSTDSHMFPIHSNYIRVWVSKLQNDDHIEPYREAILEMFRKYNKKAYLIYNEHYYTHGVPLYITERYGISDTNNTNITDIYQLIKDTLLKKQTTTFSDISICLQYDKSHTKNPKLTHNKKKNELVVNSFINIPLYLGNDKDIFKSKFTVQSVTFDTNKYTKILTEYASDIFKPNYSTICNKKRQPEILNASEIGDIDKKTLLEYPIESGNYYTCNNNKAGYTFPGLITYNTSINAPCCFEKDQTKKKQTTSEKQPSEYVLKSESILASEGQKGIVSQDFSQRLNMIEATTNKIYKRVGVKNNGFSLLACILAADSIDEDPKKVFSEYKDKNFLYVGKQEMYNLSIEDITLLIDDICDEKEYIMHELFISIFEILYKKNIFVLDIDGNLVKPVYKKSYHKNYIYKDTIIIIKHESIPYPQYEIVGHQIDTNLNLMFEINFEQLKLLCEQYDYTQNYATYTQLPPILNTTITDQHIDLYGKCRKISIKYEDDEFTFTTPPIQPFDAPVSGKFEYKQINIAKIDKLIEVGFRKTENFNIFQIGNITMKLVGQEEDEISKINEYKKYKKLAKYISEYSVWKFSNYINIHAKHESNVVDHTYVDNVEENVLPKFIEATFKIDEEYDYVFADFSDNFTEIPSFVVDSKIIIKSTDTLDRIRFILKMKLRRFTDELLNYYIKTNFTNLLTDIYDFSDFKNTTVFYEKTLKTRKSHIDDPHILYKKITPEILRQSGSNQPPYLLSSADIIQDQIYVVKTEKIYGSTKEQLNNLLLQKKPPIKLYNYNGVRLVETVNTPIDLKTTPVIGYKVDDNIILSSCIPII
jgi:hypothetical protein